MKRLLLLTLSVIMSINIMSQSISAKERQQCKQMYIQAAKELNQQTPIAIDEYTTLFSVTFMNWVYSYNYRINFDCSSISKEDFDEMLSNIKKEAIIDQRKLIDYGRYGATRSEMKRLFKALGFKFRYNYSDINGRFLGSFEYDYRVF